MGELKYAVSDSTLSSTEFIDLVQRVWPGEYDLSQTETALKRTINITAREENLLVGTVRVLSDGYLFGTIPELLVDPNYQGRGIGRRLMELAWEATPSSLFFGAQPGKETFYEKLGYERSLQSFFRRKPRR